MAIDILKLETKQQWSNDFKISKMMYFSLSTENSISSQLSVKFGSRQQI